MASPDLYAQTLYWAEYRTVGSHRLLRGAADLQESRGDGYTLRDVASRARIDYPVALGDEQALRESERTWQEQVGSDVPIRLPSNKFVKTGEPTRTVYSLPDDMVRAVRRLAKRR